MCDDFLNMINKPSNYQKSRDSDFIKLNGFDKVALLQPKPVVRKDEDLISIYWHFWDKIFFETFLNIIGSFTDQYFKNSSILPYIKIDFQNISNEKIIMLEISNPTISPNTDGEVDPKEPSKEGGIRGFGLYGNRVIINDTLNKGTYHIEIKNGIYYTRIRIHADIIGSYGGV